MNLEPLLKSAALAEARGSDLSMTPTEVRLLAAEFAKLEAEINDQSSRLDFAIEQRDRCETERLATLVALNACSGRLDKKEREINQLMRQYDRVSSEKFTAEDALKAAEARLASIRVAATELLTAVASDDGPSYEDVV